MVIDDHLGHAAVMHSGEAADDDVRRQRMPAAHAGRQAQSYCWQCANHAPLTAELAARASERF
jgi:hypothetical protein